MCMFQSFTGHLISALRDDAAINIEHDHLCMIYNELPSFLEVDRFCDWVKDASLKHPLRRTPKQHQWLYVVEQQQRQPSKTKIAIEKMIVRAADIPASWAKRAYTLENLLIDPSPRWFFRNNPAIKVVEAGQDASCLICTNDFDSDLHLAQQAPCGHQQCRQCHQDSLKLVASTHKCAFCRACLVCGTNDCQHHIIPDLHKVQPFPLHELLKQTHWLCIETCVAEEPLSGLTPKQFWALREGTRKARSNWQHLERVQAHNLDPEHRANVIEEQAQLGELLQYRIELARQGQTESGEMNQDTADGL